MPAPNREDIYIRHNVELAELSKGEVLLVKKRLNRFRNELLEQLTGFGKLTTWKRERLETQIRAIENMISDFYAALESETMASMTSLADLEAQWNASALGSIAGEAVTIAPVSPTHIMQAVRSTPYQGEVFAGWWNGLDSGMRKSVSQAIRHAWATGGTVKNVEQSLGAVFAKSVRNTEIVIRSGIMDLAATARNETFQKNADIIQCQVWLATLDGHTSHICLMRDGKKYSLEGKPIDHSYPYLQGPGKAHWGCRSSAFTILKGENAEKIVASLARPGINYNLETKSKGAKATFRYDPEENKVVKKGQRAPSAEYRGKAQQTKSHYEDWFRRQPAWMQDRILGKRKAALYRSGKMKLSTFSEDGIRPLTIKELQEKGYTL